MADDLAQAHHVARLAFLAMAARGVAASEFENDPEIHSVVITLARDPGQHQPSLDVSYHGTHGFPIGGMSL